MAHPPGEPARDPWSPAQGPGASASSPARVPLWAYFLTPAAVLLAAAAITAAIVVTDSGSEPLPAPLPVAPAEVTTAAVEATPATEPTPAVAETATAAATPAAPRVATTLGEALEGYAASLALDGAQFRECLASPAIEDAVNDHLQRGIALGVSGTPTFFVSNKRIVGAQPAAIFTEVIDAELEGSPTALDGYSAAVQALAATDPPRFSIVPERPDLAGAAIEGDPAAAVVVIEYSDFQCPFCERWYTDTLPVLRQRVGGDVALAFFHFPLVQIHPNAAGAHFAAECAGRQGKFWEMHDLLFDRQREWSALPN